ncbi:MAG TPA: alanine--tRNA ligase [Coxiellaceae bacterium]|nr:alanine--tRNA ligase [Coxiellaceae bacterium]
MKHWSSEALREAFLTYFEEKGHRVVKSASLVPANDPTLLFTNAGMVPFKDVFLGIDQRDYDRATSSQRCVRAGGKHNDLENVGYTARHHTFFEMLGNFSFGAYFKREAIEFAWDFLTVVLGIPENKLWVSVYEGDRESEAIWLEELEVSRERFSRCGDKDNFWSMGEVGPCGPCTEIFYDHGDHIPGGPPGSPDEDGDRYVEIWNLVFMQFNRDAQGVKTPLPKPCVDTGMGLERIAAVMQGVTDNFDTDVFAKLLKKAGELLDCPNLSNKSLRVVVDHIRSSAFLIADGVMPSNEGRGYVLRRIIRRAIRHGYKLGVNKVFFYKLVPTLVSVMGAAFPELRKTQSLIEQTLEREERSFAKTLATGVKLFEQAIAHLEGNVVPGDVVFSLYDTYGFPPDLTADMARERNLLIDEAGFERAMAVQRRQSQAAQQFTAGDMKHVHIADETTFIGYDHRVSSATVTTLLHDHLPVNELHEGEEAIVILDQSPFYAESGGQVGDSGVLTAPGMKFQVLNTQQHGKAILHIGRMLMGTMHTAMTLEACVDEQREDIKLNHSATHLLHAALRDQLGEHVFQKGSLVEVDRLRFDFSHPKALTAGEWQQVEDQVNAMIRANHVVEQSVMSMEDAQSAGAMALFGEKYDDDVRVITMGEGSKELCGGTHVERTGDIGLFVIISEAATASGVRRIEALTGRYALEWVQAKRRTMRHLSQELSVPELELVAKVSQVLMNQKQQQRTIHELQRASLGQQVDALSSQAVSLSNVQVLSQVVCDIDRSALRDLLDQFRSRFSTYAIVLALVVDGKIHIVAGVSQDLTKTFKAGDLLKHVAQQVGGKGGGRPDFAQGGGDQPEHLNTALQSVTTWVEQQCQAGRVLED